MAYANSTLAERLAKTSFTLIGFEEHVGHRYENRYQLSCKDCHNTCWRSYRQLHCQAILPCIHCEQQNRIKTLTERLAKANFDLIGFEEHVGHHFQNRYQLSCKACHNTYWRNYYQMHHKWIAPCAHCHQQNRIKTLTERLAEANFDLISSEEHVGNQHQSRYQLSCKACHNTYWRPYREIYCKAIARCPHCEQQNRINTLTQRSAEANFDLIGFEEHVGNRLQNRYQLSCKACHNTYWRNYRQMHYERIVPCPHCHQQQNLYTAGRIFASQIQAHVSQKFPNLRVINEAIFEGATKTQLQLQCIHHPSVKIRWKHLEELKNNMHNPCFRCGTRKTTTLEEVEYKLDQSRYKELRLRDYAGYHNTSKFRCMKHFVNIFISFKNLFRRKTHPCPHCRAREERAVLLSHANHFYCHGCQKRYPMEKRIQLTARDGRHFYRCNRCSLRRAKVIAT